MGVREGDDTHSPGRTRYIRPQGHWDTADTCVIYEFY